MSVEMFTSGLSRGGRAPIGTKHSMSGLGVYAKEIVRDSRIKMGSLRQCGKGEL